jgi:hypothetical protein
MQEEPFQWMGNFLMWAILVIGLVAVGSGLFRVFSNDPVNIPDAVVRFGFGGVMILGSGVYLWRRRRKRRLKEKIVLRAIY